MTITSNLTYKTKLDTKPADATINTQAQQKATHMQKTVTIKSILTGLQSQQPEAIKDEIIYLIENKNILETLNIGDTVSISKLTDVLDDGERWTIKENTQ